MKADESPQAKRAYDAPSKGVLWGWEVSAYIWTKAIASGTYLVATLLWLGDYLEMETQLWWLVVGTGLAFLGITGALLVLDLDRAPESRQLA